MGVQHLWDILEQCKRTESVEQLRDKTLCIDLSLWICEAQGTKGLKDQLKPYLRNVFFRTMYLASIGVRPVFVIDGIPPEIKRDTIIKRLQGRTNPCAKRQINNIKTNKKKLTRSKFSIWCDECCEMFRLLGIPFVKSEGEAEATCAWLNNYQYADGVLTNDGDVFLYGAKIVYKDFNISSSKSPTDCLQVYYSEDIASNLGLNQRNLVALGLLLGCDYLPTGVPGIGKETAVKLFSSLPGVDLLHRFQEWKESPDHHPALYTRFEVAIKRKAVKVSNFPDEAVIREFLSPKIGKANMDIKWKYPDIEGIKDFFLRKLDWPKEYSEEKMFHLGTDWQLATPAVTLFVPIRIIKARMRQKVEYYEIEWQTQDLETKWPINFVSLKTKETMREKHPTIVESFETEMAAKMTKTKGKSKKDSKMKSTPCSDQTDELHDLLSRINNMDLEENPKVACSDESSAASTHNIDKPNGNKPTKETSEHISNGNVLRQLTTSDRFSESKQRELKHVSSKDQCTASRLGDFSVNDSIFPDGLEHLELPDASPGSTLSPALNETNRSGNLVDITIDQSFGSEVPSIDDFLASSFVARLDLSHMDLSSPATMSSRISTPHLGKISGRNYQFQCEEGDLVDSLDELFLNSGAELEEQEAVVGLADCSGSVSTEVKIKTTPICTPQEEASLTSRLLKRFQKQQGTIVNTLRLISSGDDNDGAKIGNAEMKKINNEAIERQLKTQTDVKLGPLYDITNQKKDIDCVVLD